MKKRLPFLLLILIGLALLISFYGKPLFSPNDYLFSDSGDGLKNYYTYYYHIRHDTSCTEFQGMNYPYGEHFLYTDCHPLISSILRVFDQDGSIAAYSIGVINFMMIISIFLTLILLYALLREFGIKSWIAFLFSIGIALLSPQIFRMTGHLSLSYSIAIPLAWLLMIRIYKAKRKLRLLLVLFLLNIFWLFIHAYLGMILIAFQAAFWLILILMNRKVWKAFIHAIYALSFLLPLAFFQLFLKLTDIHNGRTDNPSGFFLYNAEPDDLFLPHHPPLRPLLNQINGLHIDQEWEAWSYIGLAFTILLLVFLITAIVRIFRKNNEGLFRKITSNTLLNISMIASLLVLLFAFAFPFKMFPELTDIFPILKQFRATGRFSWIFFFTASVFAVFILQEIFRHLKKKPVFAYGIILIAGLLTIAEGIPYHLKTSKHITRTDNLFLAQHTDPAYRAALEVIDIKDYQALIPLPFFYYGSEAYSRPSQPHILKHALLFSAYTGLPQFSAYLTRTSVPESRDIVQIISPSWYNKKIEKDIRSDKSFLIISSDEDLTIYEQMIINKAEIVFSSGDFSLFRLEKEDLFQHTAQAKLMAFSLLSEDLSENNGFLLSDSLARIYYNSFEEHPCEPSFRGDGAYEGEKKGKNTFAEFPPGTFSANKEYIVSAWMYNNSKDALNLWFRFMVEEYEEANDRWHITTTFPESSEVIYGDWSLVEMIFTVNDPANQVYIVSKGKDNSKAPLYLDDLLIREAGVDVYKLEERDSGAVLFLNNHEITGRK